MADRVSHAYIFAGPDGIGKFKTSREWAKLLLCKKPLQNSGLADSCGSCQSCTQFETGTHPDFHHIYKELREFTKDGKGKSAPLEMPIDVVREFIIEKTTIRPTLSQQRVFVLTEAEKLNISSQNALLKVLEEPPSYCHIILICTRPENLLATIKSRSQIVRFGPVAQEKIIDHLAHMGLEPNCSKYFARLAAGSLGTACQWAKLELAGANLYKIKTELLENLATYEYADSLKLAADCLEKSKKLADSWYDLDETVSKKDIARRASKTLIRIIVAALQDVMKYDTDEKEIINFDQTEQVQKLTQRFCPETAAEKISKCSQALSAIDASVNEKLVFEQLLLNLANSDTIKA